MKVYIITSGSYSDYCVHGVMSSKEKAEKYVNDQNMFDYYYNDYSYEEVELDELDPIEKAKFVYIPKTNTVIDCRTYHIEFGPAAVSLASSYLSEKYEIECATGVTFFSFDEVKELLKNTYFSVEQYKYINKAAKEFQDGIYKVTVNYNEDYDVMKKAVFDKIAAYKEYIKDLSA